MKKIVHKPYWNYEKEEIWLNQMASKGFGLTDYSWCRYVFEDCKPNEYTYRLELLDDIATSQKSQEYLEFLKENDIECVAKYLRWVYLRKKTDDGPFELFSNSESKYRYLKKVYHFWLVIMLIEFSIGIINVSLGISNFLIDEFSHDIFNFNLIIGLLLICFGVFFFKIAQPIHKKIKKLKKQMLLHE